MPIRVILIDDEQTILDGMNQYRGHRCNDA